MAWHKKYLMVFLAILLNAKIFGFDPGERDTISLVTTLTPEADEEFTSVTETRLSATESSESSTTSPHAASVTSVSQSESITTIPQPESNTADAQPESITAILRSESSTTDLQSTSVASISRFPTTITHLEYTSIISQSETSTIPRFDSVTTIPRSESITTIPQSESITTIPRSESIPMSTTSYRSSTHVLGYNDQTPSTDRNIEASNTPPIRHLTPEETTRAMQDLRMLYTHHDGQYIKVNKDGTMSFSHDRSFSISMPECSIPAYFDSYAVLGDLSLYKSLALTTANTEPCKWKPRKYKGYRRRGKYVHHYIRDGHVTFSSGDTPFVNNSEPVDSNTPAFCFLLRSPPHTDLLVDMQFVQDGDELVQGVEVELYFETPGRHYYYVRDPTRYSEDVQIRRPSNALLVLTNGLHRAFRQPGRRLTISFRAEPRCTKPALEMKYPVNSTTGWFLLSGSLSRCLILPCLCTLTM